MSASQEQPRPITPPEAEAMRGPDLSQGAKEKTSYVEQSLQDDEVKKAAEAKASFQKLTQALGLIQNGAEQKNMENAFDLLMDIESMDKKIDAQLNQVRGFNLLVLAAMYRKENSDTSLACYEALLACCNDDAIRARALDERANIYEERKDPTSQRIIDANRALAKKLRNGAEDMLGTVDAKRLLQAVHTLQENVKNPAVQGTLYFKKVGPDKKNLLDK